MGLPQDIQLNLTDADQWVKDDVVEVMIETSLTFHAFYSPLANKSSAAEPGKNVVHDTQ